MRYKINESVYVYNEEKEKKIVDCENIIGVNIYYMSDGTSYSEEQIKISYCEYHEYHDLDGFITNNKEKILKLFDTEKLSSQLYKFYSENKKSKKNKNK